MKIITYFKKSIIMGFCFTLVTFSCSVDNSYESQSFKYKLEPLKEISFKIDKTSTYQPQYIYYDDINNELIIAQPHAFRIDVYDYQKAKIKYSYKLEKDNIYNAKEIESLFLLSKDSLYVYFTNFKLARIDSLGRFAQVFNLPSTDNDNNSIYYKGRSYRPMIYRKKDNELILSIIPYGGYYGRNYWKVPLAMSFNIQNAKSSFLKKPPSEYLDLKYSVYYLHYGVSYNENDKLVYSFPFDNDILVYDLNDSSIRQKDAPSAAFDKVEDFKGNSLELDDEQFYIENGSFKEIIYDKWRKVYYRFAYAPTELYRTDGRRRTWYDKTVSIIILNEQFAKIGESFLKADYFFPQNTFVTPEGLHVSTNHDLNPNLDEDHISFVVFDLIDGDN